MANVCPTRVVCKKTRETISELGFLPNKRMKSESLAIFFRCRTSDEEVILVFHDYSTITRVKYALFWPHSRLFFAVVMHELCQSKFHLFCRFALNTLFWFARVVITGGG